MHDSSEDSVIYLDLDLELAVWTRGETHDIFNINNYSIIIAKIVQRTR